MTDPRVRIRDADRTSAELLDVATAAFAESGFSGTRVDDIAERTRTTKRMIYYYFGGKEQLYLAVLEKAYRGIREAEQHSDFIRLVSIENIHRGQFIRRLESLREVNQPALDVHLVVGSYCFFQVANQYTFGYLFDRDLLAPERRDHLRGIIGDVVVAWLTTAPR